MKNSVAEFNSQDLFTRAAGLSYYMVFSLPPMLLVVVWLTSMWFEEVHVRESIFEEFAELIGNEGADKLEATMTNLTVSQPGLWKTVLWVATLSFTASTVFVTAKDALNSIFKVKLDRSVQKSAIMMIVDRFLSIAMLCIIALILTLSLIVSALLTKFNEIITEWLGNSAVWLQFLDTLLFNMVVFTLLFALIFRYVPDQRLPWRDTWFGAIFTAFLFIVGKSLIGSFIGNSQLANYYDAAGGILVLMLWVYYTTLIFYFGAVLTESRASMLKKNTSESKPAQND